MRVFAERLSDKPAMSRCCSNTEELGGSQQPQQLAFRPPPPKFQLLPDGGAVACFDGWPLAVGRGVSAIGPRHDQFEFQFGPEFALQFVDHCDDQAFCAVGAAGLAGCNRAIFLR
jgi:hypothetical protein